jgi:hypothetical protein
MGIHLAAKGLDIESLTHPTSISPEPYAIRISKISPKRYTIRTPKSCHSAPERAQRVEGEEPLYFAFAFLVVIPEGDLLFAFGFYSPPETLSSQRLKLTFQ